MNVVILQHVSFEGPGTISPFFEHSDAIGDTSVKHNVRTIHLYRGDEFTSPLWPDLLIVMGGPMGVSDEAEYSWLAAEKTFISEVIESGAWVLGICLGAQLIAEVLGGQVKNNPRPEIGWYPIQTDEQLNGHWLYDILGSNFHSLHWHGDTFTIPAGAIPLGSSEACENQGFIWDERVLGFQFHLEFTHNTVRRLISECEEELNNPQAHDQSLDPKEYVSTAEELVASPDFDAANMRMGAILRYIETSISQRVVLHPQLASDCIALADWEFFWVLLHSNALIPWFIVVPKGPFRDLDDLDSNHRMELTLVTDALSELLRSQFSSEKINVAALGNMVPQLHIHVIGRHAKDCCWPQPVWGNIQGTKDWTTAEIQSLRISVNAIGTSLS